MFGSCVISPSLPRTSSDLAENKSSSIPPEYCGLCHFLLASKAKGLWTLQPCWVMCSCEHAWGGWLLGHEKHVVRETKKTNLAWQHPSFREKKDLRFTEKSSWPGIKSFRMSLGHRHAWFLRDLFMTQHGLSTLCALELGQFICVHLPNRDLCGDNVHPNRPQQEAG